MARLAGQRQLEALGWLRIAIGTGLVARPALLPRTLGVDMATARQVGWAGAMVGARDIALGAGLVTAARRGSDCRPWLLAAAFSDAIDALAFSGAVLRGSAAPVTGLGGAVVAAGGVATGLRAYQELARA